MIVRCHAPHALPCKAQRRQRTVRVLAEFKLIDGQGRATSYNQPQCSVGSASSCDVRLTGSGVEEQHALIVQKGKQTFLKPLVGESLLDESRCWKDGQPLRPRVAYVLASGSRLAFGTEDQVLTIQFEEGGGGNPLMELMMKGMLANSSPEVKRAMGGGPPGPGQ